MVVPNNMPTENERTRSTHGIGHWAGSLWIVVVLGCVCVSIPNIAEASKIKGYFNKAAAPKPTIKKAFNRTVPKGRAKSSFNKAAKSKGYLKGGFNRSSGAYLNRSSTGKTSKVGMNLQRNFNRKASQRLLNQAFNPAARSKGYLKGTFNRAAFRQSTTSKSNKGTAAKLNIPPQRTYPPQHRPAPAPKLQPPKNWPYKNDAMRAPFAQQRRQLQEWTKNNPKPPQTNTRYRPAPALQLKIKGSMLGSTPPRSNLKTIFNKSAKPSLSNQFNRASQRKK
ncbi:MAG TPA: hypothetical protein DEA90_04480 [Opitutae bacterium]|nr:hypothetical protein [Opitutae bacterium]